jgi:hypothetical protein
MTASHVRVHTGPHESVSSHDESDRAPNPEVLVN